MAVPTYEMLIDGQWVAACDGAVIESVNPATGEVWCRVPEATEADVDRAVRAAYRAFEEGPWSRMMPNERGKMLRRLAEFIQFSAVVPT